MFQTERYRSLGSNKELLPILSSRNGEVAQTMSRKWPHIYWFILKVLCLIHGRKIVSKRICHKCRLIRLQSARDVNMGPLPNFLYPSAVASPAGWHDDDDDSRPLRDENVNLVLEDEPDECQVCLSNWWDADGHHNEYSEDEIGEFLNRNKRKKKKKTLIFFPQVFHISVLILTVRIRTKYNK